MIETYFYFPNPCLPLLLEALLDLPADLRPQFFSYGERLKSKKDLVEDRDRFEPFLKKALSGFFLFSKKLLFSFLIRGGVEIELFVYKASNEDAKILVQRLSKCLPAFGYASDVEEHRHRNTVSKQASYGHETAGVGNDWRRYIPGVYWMTVIPTTLAEQHGVSIDQLKALALEVEESIPGVWILKFFELPEEWQGHVERLDRFCAEMPGMFSVENVRPAFEAATTFLESGAVLHPWR